MGSGLASQGETGSSIHEALDGLDELLEREGLWQEHEVLALGQIARECVVGIAGDAVDILVLEATFGRQCRESQATLEALCGGLRVFRIGKNDLLDMSPVC